jgi:predicted amidohydrolase
VRLDRQGPHPRPRQHPQGGRGRGAGRRAQGGGRAWHLGGAGLSGDRPRGEEGADGRYANRTFVIDDKGAIAARYDKMHMFDVDLATGERWRESAAYAPGKGAVVVETPLGRLGLAICYDLRFPALFEALGQAKCDVIAIPAAFTVPTGAAHWHLLRARAVEASAWVVSSAQVGTHEDGRATYGHSLVVDPWGGVALDMGGEAAGVAFAEIDPSRTAEVRAQLPSLSNRRPVGPQPSHDRLRPVVRGGRP